MRVPLPCAVSGRANAGALESREDAVCSENSAKKLVESARKATEQKIYFRAKSFPLARKILPTSSQRARRHPSPAGQRWALRRIGHWGARPAGEAVRGPERGVAPIRDSTTIG